MSRHLLHQAIGQIIDKDWFPDCEILKDPACDPEQGRRITLFHETAPKLVRFCDVDLLIAVKGKAKVIIEIEESNVKPVQIFGKFFASAFSTHYGKPRRLSPIDESVLFIQVVDSSALKIGKTKKVVQWSSIEYALQCHLRSQHGRITRYKLIKGKPYEFKRDLAGGDLLIETIRDFLDESS